MNDASSNSPLRRLVVGDDGAEGGVAALTVALGLRRQLGSDVLVVRALSLPDPEDTAGRPDQIALRRIELEQKFGDLERVRIAELLEEGEESPDIAVRCEAPARVLLDLATESGADAIVLGPHTKKDVFDFGRTARVVLAKSPCAVWVQPGPPATLERVIVPVDLSEHSLAALAAGRDLARALDLPLIALHAYPPPSLVPPSGTDLIDPEVPTYVIEQQAEIARQRFEKALDDFEWGGVPHARRFEVAAPEDAIYEVQGRADLVVMGTHGHTGLAAAILGGVAYSALKHARGPVLALRHADASWQI